MPDFNIESQLPWPTENKQHFFTLLINYCNIFQKPNCKQSNLRCIVYFVADMKKVFFR